MSLSRDNITSLQEYYVEDLDYTNNTLLIEAEATKINCTIVRWYFYILYYLKDNLQYQLLENVMYDDNKGNENVEKVMLLTIELLEKYK